MRKNTTGTDTEVKIVAGANEMWKTSVFRGEISYLGKFDNNTYLCPCKKVAG